MPIPLWVGRFNRRVANPAVRTISGRAPYFGTLIHVGRTTGAEYRTPVNPWLAEPADRPPGAIVALTYGSDADWVKNTLAAGGCRLLHRGTEIAFVDPELISEGEAVMHLPGSVRAGLRALRVYEFLWLTRA